MKKIPVPGIMNAAKTLTKPGGCNKVGGSGRDTSGIIGQIPGGHVLVMNSSFKPTTLTRNIASGALEHYINVIL